MTPTPLRLIVIASVSAWLTNCGGTTGVEQAIPETPPDAVLQLSRISTPILIPIDELRSLVDRRLSGELYSESRQITTGVTLDIAVNRRNAPIAMDISGSTLTTVVPLNVNGSVTLGFGPFSIGRPEGFDADLDVEINIVCRIEFGLVPGLGFCRRHRCPARGHHNTRYRRQCHRHHRGDTS